MSAAGARDSFSATLLELQRISPGRVRHDVSLAPLVRWQIGGSARVFVEAGSAAEITAIFRLMASRPEPLFLMGDASNLLFDSRGFNGVIVRVGRAMSTIRIEGTRVYAEAGAWVPNLARRAANAHLSGLEHTVGIPGALGGLIQMNGGSQRKGIGQCVVSVDCVNRAAEQINFTREECAFAYRSSAFQQGGLAIVAAELELTPGDRGAILRDMIDIMTSRKSRFPKNLPNGGSTFLSTPEMYEAAGPPGKIIEALGLKGIIQGRAQISPQHANFIVNLGGATSEDVLWLIHRARAEGYRATGHKMDAEVRYVSYDGNVRPAHEVAEERFGPIGS